MKLRQQDLDARSELLAQGYIHCTKCDTTKSVEDFNISRTTWSGRDSKCKTCVAEYRRTYKRDPVATAKRRQEQAELRKRDLKTCSRCKHLKCRSEFYLSPSQPDGLHNRCRQCTMTDAAKSQANAKANDPYHKRLKDGYYRAKAAGLPHRWFDGKELVAYWEGQGISPDHDAYTGQPLEDGWHLEHVHALSDPDSPGHVLSNVVPANPGTNSAKGKKHLVHFLADRSESGKYPVDESTRQTILEASPVTVTERA